MPTESTPARAVITTSTIFVLFLYLIFIEPFLVKPCNKTVIPLRCKVNDLISYMQEIKAIISEKILAAYKEASKLFPKEAIVTYSDAQKGIHWL